MHTLLVVVVEVALLELNHKTHTLVEAAALVDQKVALLTLTITKVVGGLIMVLTALSILSLVYTEQVMVTDL